MINLIEMSEALDPTDLTTRDQDISQHGSGGGDDSSLSDQLSELTISSKESINLTQEEMELVKIMLDWYKGVCEGTVDINKLFDDKKTSLSSLNVMKMKGIQAKVYDKDDFISELKTNVVSWKESYRKSREKGKTKEAFETLCQSIIGIANTNGVLSTHLVELHKIETLNDICVIIRDVLVGPDSKVYEKFLESINKHTLKKIEENELFILTEKQNALKIDNMSIREMMDRICDEAFILVCDKWGSKVGNLSYEYTKDYIKKALIIKFGENFRNFFNDDIESLIDKIGFNYLFTRALEYEIIGTSYNKDKFDQINKHLKKLDDAVFKGSKKQEVKKNKVKNESIHIPSNIYRSMDKNLVKSIKDNHGKANQIKQESLSNQSDEVVKYVLSLPGSEHLSSS